MQNAAVNYNVNRGMNIAKRLKARGVNISSFEIETKTVKCAYNEFTNLRTGRRTIVILSSQDKSFKVGAIYLADPKVLSFIEVEDFIRSSTGAERAALKNWL